MALASITRMLKKRSARLADNLSMVPMPPKIVAAQAKAPLLSAEASNAILALIEGWSCILLVSCLLLLVASVTHNVLEASPTARAWRSRLTA